MTLLGEVTKKELESRREKVSVGLKRLAPVSYRESMKIIEDLAEKMRNDNQSL